MNSLIQPIYTTEQANAPISLGRSPIEINCANQLIKCEGQANLRLLPSPRLIVTAKFTVGLKDALSLASATQSISLKYGSDSPAIPVHLLRTTGSSSQSEGENGEAELCPIRENLTVCANRRKRLVSVTFHVVNFPRFLSIGADSKNIKYCETPNKEQLLGRAILSDDDWHLEIQELPGTKALVEGLRSKGGYAITHVGQLKRHGGRSFTISAAERALRELHLFLSFARGLSSPVVLSVGFDSQGKRIYENWGIQISTPWETCFSWFDTNHGETFSLLYPKFVALLRHPQLGKPVRDALYWYLRSSRAGAGAGVDSGIILSQAALERLSYAYLEKEKLPTDGSAADRLRRACQHLGLPTAVPKAASQIYNARRRKVWSDVPDAITKVRNELIHPKDRLKIPIGKVVPSTWMLAQWYIELFILRLCGYDGVYSSRLRARWRGEVENVPWVRKR